MRVVTALVPLMFWHLYCSASGVLVPPHSSNSGNSLPFGLFREGLDSMRYQQVYSSDQFDYYFPQGMYIQSIEFQGTFIFGSEQPDFEVSLSITPRQPDGLSTVFSENIGNRETVVFGPSSISWPNKLDDSSGFFYSIPLDAPYYYDPSLGNLLMDVRNYQAEEPADRFDVFNSVLSLEVLGDDTSRVYADSVDAISGTADTLGLITKFTVQGIPEPSGVALYVLGLALLGGKLWLGRGGRY